MTELVGGFNPSEKYWSMGRIIPYIMENKKCSKPPISESCPGVQFVPGMKFKMLNRHKSSPSVTIFMGIPTTW